MDRGFQSHVLPNPRLQSVSDKMRFPQAEILRQGNVKGQLFVLSVVMQVDRVCQASAMIAMEPVVIPTQYFNPKRRVLTNIDNHPSQMAKRFF